MPDSKLQLIQIQAWESAHPLSRSHAAWCWLAQSLGTASAHSPRRCRHHRGEIAGCCQKQTVEPCHKQPTEAVNRGSLPTGRRTAHHSIGVGPRERRYLTKPEPTGGFNLYSTSRGSSSTGCGTEERTFPRAQCPSLFRAGVYVCKVNAGPAQPKRGGGGHWMLHGAVSTMAALHACSCHGVAALCFPTALTA